MPNVKISRAEARLVLDLLDKAKASLAASGHGLTSGTLKTKMEGLAHREHMRPGESVLNDSTGAVGIIVEELDEWVIVARADGSMNGYSIERWDADVVVSS